MLPLLFKLMKMKRCQAHPRSTASLRRRGLVQVSVRSPGPPSLVVLPRQSPRKLLAKGRNCAVHPHAPPRPAGPRTPAPGARPSPASWIASFSIAMRSRQTCSGSSAGSWGPFTGTWPIACMPSARAGLTSPASSATCIGH